MMKSSRSSPNQINKNKSVRIVEPMYPSSRHQETISLLHIEDDVELLNLDDIIPQRNSAPDSVVHRPASPAKPRTPFANSLYQRAVRLQEYRRAAPVLSVEEGGKLQDQKLSWRERLNATPPPKYTPQAQQGRNLLSQEMTTTRSTLPHSSRVHFDLAAVNGENTTDLERSNGKRLWELTEASMSEDDDSVFTASVSVANPYDTQQTKTFVHPFDDAAFSPLDKEEVPGSDVKDQAENVAERSSSEDETRTEDKTPIQQDENTPVMPDFVAKAHVPEATKDAVIHMVDIDDYFSPEAMHEGTKFRAFDFPMRKKTTSLSKVNGRKSLIENTFPLVKTSDDTEKETENDQGLSTVSTNAEVETAQNIQDAYSNPNSIDKRLIAQNDEKSADNVSGTYNECMEAVNDGIVLHPTHATLPQEVTEEPKIGTQKRNVKSSTLPVFTYEDHLHNQEMANQVLNSICSKDTADRAVRGITEYAFSEAGDTDIVSDIKKEVTASKVSTVWGFPETLGGAALLVEDLTGIGKTKVHRKQQGGLLSKSRMSLGENARRILERKRANVHMTEDISDSSISAPPNMTASFPRRSRSRGAPSKMSIQESDSEAEIYDSTSLPYVVKLIDQGCAWIERGSGFIPCEKTFGNSSPSLYKAAVGGNEASGRNLSPMRFKSPKHKSVNDPMGLSFDSSSGTSSSAIPISSTGSNTELDAHSLDSTDENITAHRDDNNSGTVINLARSPRPESAQTRIEAKDGTESAQQKLSKRMEVIRLAKGKPDAPEERKTLSPRNRTSPARSRTMGGPEGFVGPKPMSSKKEAGQNSGMKRKQEDDSNENDPRLVAIELAERLRIRAEALKEKRRLGRDHHPLNYTSSFNA